MIFIKRFDECKRLISVANLYPLILSSTFRPIIGQRVEERRTIRLTDGWNIPKAASGEATRNLWAQIPP
jgi:hypothetical protein